MCGYHAQRDVGAGLQAALWVDWEFHPGDLVWLSTANLRYSGQGTRKLDHLRCGPFPVTVVVSPVPDCRRWQSAWSQQRRQMT